MSLPVLDAPPATVPTTTRRVFQLATLLTLLAVALGSVVCASESGFECGNWPGCTASALLPSGPVTSFFSKNPWIEMTHRTSAILAGPLALAAGFLALRLRQVHPVVKVLPWVTVAGALVAGYVGRLTVLGMPVPSWVGAFDLGSALTAMVAMVVATVTLDRTSARGHASRASLLGWTGLVLIVAMHLVSLFAAGKGSYTRCLSWPVWEVVTADRAAGAGVQVVRVVLAVLAMAAVVGTVVLARTREPRWSVGAAVLLCVVLLFGLVIRLSHSDQLGIPFSLATVGLVWTQAQVAARTTFRRPTA
ncbi:MAG TPA: COX15/CtaA family protein [Propionibacteriaceae bacterium]|nr:COX15/CtaA family protein [Propionibacteriaceae bacterium]